MLKSRMVSGLMTLIVGGLLLSASWAIALDDTTVSFSSGPGSPGPATRDAPVLMMSFPDAIPMHNMSLTSDGTYYYTSNGGSSGSGQINTYDLSGTLVTSVSIPIDARGILYSEYLDAVFIKSYDLNWYEVDPATGGYTLVFAELFVSYQSSPGLAFEGAFILEHADGTIYKYDSGSGALVETLSGFYFGGFPSSEALACNGTRIFTWDGTLVYVYDLAGNFLESWPVPNGHYGFSLSFANGLLWTSDDGGGGTGTWYGYDVGPPVAIEALSWGGVKSLYR
jgi:hypothetical protein